VAASRNGKKREPKPMNCAAAKPSLPRLLALGLAAAAALPLLPSPAAADEINLGSAGNFSILAGSTITSTGATVVNGGDLGVSPGSALTGFPPAILAAPYAADLGDAPAADAQHDLAAAFTAAAGLGVTQNLTGEDLGGLTLTPGVYAFASSAQLTGTLTLDDLGNPAALFVFQIGSTLTTAAGSAVVSIDDPGPPGGGVFWQIGSSATLGSGTAFEGNILASASITLDAGVNVEGRLLAESGAVTLIDDSIMVPPEVTTRGGGSSVAEVSGTFWLLGFGLTGLSGLRRLLARAPAKLGAGCRA
jgi:hypothetical protein